MSSLNFVGAPDFNDRILPRHSSSGSRRSRTNSHVGSIDPRLSIIEEDRPAPASPQKTHNRPFSRRFLGEPPRYSSGHSPPKYALWDVTGPNGEKFEDLRNNAYIARRGGWKRVCIVTLVVVAILIALIVGLGVGLGMKKNNTSSSPVPSPSSTSSASTGPFPAGSYTFTTFLSTISTNCTSNAASWTCQPSITYATSPTDSLATFNWVITPAGPTSTNFSISSTNNPFAIDFSNTSLSLLDQGAATERYTFSVQVTKLVFPTSDVRCHYNTTTFSADLYTKKPKTYPSAAPSSAAAAPTASPIAFADWAYAVDATQSAPGGTDVPQCYSWANGQDGAPVTQGYAPQPLGSSCTCAYKNYDP